MKQRNMNVESLRMLSMYMVLVLHALRWSGALEHLWGIQYWVYWGIEALGIVAVNVFMLISGYFQVNGRFKIQSVARIAVTVWIYSVMFALLDICIEGKPISSGDIVKAVLPITTNKYWFVNSYLAVYLLSPFVNRMLHSISKQQLSALLALLIGMFSIRLTVFPTSWSQDMTGGLGILWLGTLYVVGSWLRITGWGQKRSSLKFGIVYIAIAFLIVSVKGVMLKVGIQPELTNKVYGYSCILVLIESVSLFLCFVNMPELGGTLSLYVGLLAKHSFSVYIIHFAMINVIFTKIAHLDKLTDNALLFVPAMLVVCAGIYIGCIAIDIVKETIGKSITVTNRFLPVIKKIDSAMNG